MRHARCYTASRARRTRRSARRGARPGFTLLELILAMAIAATLSLVLYASLSTAFQARATAVRQTESMREAAIALDLIEADLGNVIPAGTMDADTGEYALLGPFIGEASGSGENAAGTLTFRCLGRTSKAALVAGIGATDARTAMGSSQDAEEDPLADGIREVTYSLVNETGTGKNVLTRSVVRNLLSASTAEAEEESLAGNVRGLAFRFFDGSDWTDAWHSEDNDNLLPAAVEVTITLERPGVPGRDGAVRTYQMARVIPLACADLDALTGGAE